MIHRQTAYHPIKIIQPQTMRTVNRTDMKRVSHPDLSHWKR